MKRTLWIGLAVALVVAAGAAAQTVVDTEHDLSSSGPNTVTNVGRVCVFCHTPHQAAGASSQDPLWNHTISTAGPYTTYTSGTLDHTPVNIPVATVGSAETSQLCLSCHDGTVSVASMYNPPNEVTVTVSGGGDVGADGLLDAGDSFLGTDLSNDHPVNFVYDATLATNDGGLNDPTTAAVDDLLDSNNEVQCASCHDPHDNTKAGGPFMRLVNTDSALCTTCHIK